MDGDDTYRQVWEPLICPRCAKWAEMQGPFDTHMKCPNVCYITGQISGIPPSVEIKQGGAPSIPGQICLSLNKKSVERESKKGAENHATVFSLKKSDHFQRSFSRQRSARCGVQTDDRFTVSERLSTRSLRKKRLLCSLLLATLTCSAREKIERRKTIAPTPVPCVKTQRYIPRTGYLVYVASAIPHKKRR